MVDRNLSFRQFVTRAFQIMEHAAVVINVPNDSLASGEKQAPRNALVQVTSVSLEVSKELVIPVNAFWKHMHIYGSAVNSVQSMYAIM